MEKIKIPLNVNPEWFNARFRDRYCYLIHKIQEEIFFNKKEYIKLDAVILKKLCGNKYREMLNELHSQGLIVCRDTGTTLQKRNRKGNLIKSENKVFEYSLSDLTRKQGLKQHTLTDNKLKGKLSVYRDTYISNLSWLKPSLDKIVIDRTRAIDFVYRNYAFTPPEKLNEKREKRIRYIDKIANNPANLLKQDKAGRVYSNVVCMAKDIRQFITVNGKELISIDISCSQLFHFIPLLLDYSGRQGIAPDVKLFNDLVLQSRIYEYLIEACNFKGSRGAFKDKFFSNIWYCSNEQPIKSPVRTAFKELFPTVWRAIRHYKENLTGYSLDTFKNFPIHLQKLESENIIDGILKDLTTSYPDKVFIPIHDCIMTTPENEKLVFETMQNYFSNKYGMIPTMKVEFNHV